MLFFYCFFFFKQKTAYEMRISDWSSDVCSSDLDRYWLPIQELDSRLPAALQLRLFGRAIGLMKHVTTWLLNNHWTGRTVHEAVAQFGDGIDALTELLPDSLPGNYRGDWDKAVAGKTADGVPVGIENQLAHNIVLRHVPDTNDIDAQEQRPLTDHTQH